MFARLASVALAVLAFGSMFAFASPITDLVTRDDSLTAILNLCLDLQVKIGAIIKVIGASSRASERA